jgi:predicted O-linked N-acetylglucosamine transferase (SPINDLY family)
MDTSEDIAKRAAALRKDGHVHWQAGRYSEAEQCLRAGLVLRPDDIGLLTDLGNLLKACGHLDEAREQFRRVVDIKPDVGEAWSNLGTVAHRAGRYADAIEHYRRALTLTPHHAAIWSNLTASMVNSLEHGPVELREMLRGFDQRLVGLLPPPASYSNSRDIERKLKVGYVSPDFRKHPVSYFFLPLLEGHRKNGRTEVYCYYSGRVEDEWTERLRSTADHWLNCAGMSDDDLAERIRSDQIDILVDLAGHTENNRLLTFARKPAPVQLTWMGYVTTTGMEAMDWRVTHIDADPQGCEAEYSEKLCRLAGAIWCFRPLPDMPAVAAPAVRRNGHVTFGSFNRYSKISTSVLQAWADILRRVNNARLLICVPAGKVRDEMLRFFDEKGIAPERIACFEKVSHHEFWALHHEVDIALDSFPFNGGTTTCESLWMGVPVVTVRGGHGDFPSRFASRMGYALLNNLGLSELAAETVADYVDLAVKLAHDPDRLQALRAGLRARMEAAPLMDEERFVREIEAAYGAMWKAWCADAAEKEEPCEKIFVHVGLGRRLKAPDGLWKERRLEAASQAQAGGTSALVDLSAVEDASVDAVLAADYIEHLYPHEVLTALAEFRRVLKPDGFLLLRCPDLQAVCALVLEDKLLEPVAQSSAGPLTPFDMLYGSRQAVAQGNLAMAHRSGFTEKVLTGTLQASGFATVATQRRGHPAYDLWSIATLATSSSARIRQLTAEFFPK